MEINFQKVDITTIADIELDDIVGGGVSPCPVMK